MPKHGICGETRQSVEERILSAFVIPRCLISLECQHAQVRRISPGRSAHLAFGAMSVFSSAPYRIGCGERLEDRAAVWRTAVRSLEDQVVKKPAVNQRNLVLLQILRGRGEVFAHPATR